MLKNRKGVSPVIATVLLIAMVVTLSLIVFIWFKSFAGETITKFGNKNIELVCNEVKMDARYSSSEIFISNIGNVPINGIKVKQEGRGKHTTKDLEMAENKLIVGGSLSNPFTLEEGTEEILLIPVLKGNADGKEKTFVCDEKNGFKIKI